MRIGFTGNRDGLTFEQLEALEEALWALRATELHHGDCVGADAEVDEIARRLGIKIIIHPSMKASQRAWRSKILPCEVLPEKLPLSRNRDIVRSVDFLVAAPAAEDELLRSRTWATIRLAVKLGVKTFVFLPSGRMEEPTRQTHHPSGSSAQEV